MKEEYTVKMFAEARDLENTGINLSLQEMDRLITYMKNVASLIEDNLELPLRVKFKQLLQSNQDKEQLGITDEAWHSLFHKLRIASALLELSNGKSNENED